MSPVQHQTLRNKQRLLVYFLATRPSFLSITLMGYLIGYSISLFSNHLVIGILGLIVALLAHAAGNVINDFHDSLNGSDLANIERIYPFTGGSRMIQDGIFTEQKISRFATTLFFTSILLGIAVIYLSSINLVLIGVLGLFLAWAYSAPPCKLMGRGLIGELSITLAWALVVIGAAMLNDINHITGNALLISIAIGLSYGFAVANILFVNQIPDVNADLSAQKRTLAATIQISNIWVYYLCFNLLAHLTILISYALGFLSVIYLLSLLSSPIHLYVTYILKTSPNQRLALRQSITLTIINAHIYGALLLLSNVFINYFDETCKAILN